MTPYDTAEQSANAISQLASRFMLDPTTYQRGAELGFPGMGFYFAGRGGVLGPVDADVVSAALVFFNPDVVRVQWEASLPVMEPQKAALEFAACGHEWAQRFPDDLDVTRLAELAGRVCEHAGVAAAPLFAGWRLVAEPDDPKALALHRMNVLRELRGNLHGAAVLAAGLTPLEAVMVKTPFMAGIFGWSDDLPDAEPCRERRAQAEDLTNTMVAPAFAALSDAEAVEFVDLANTALAATG